MAMLRDGVPTYVGRVLDIGELNFRDDSDFYAIVLKDDGTIARVNDGTTRFAAPPTARVDATPEVQAQAERALADYLFEQLKHEAGSRATKLEQGKRVRAIAGRKVPIGTEGTCFWLGWNPHRTRYANSYSRPVEGVNEDRIGVRLADGESYFGDKHNWEVANPGDNMPSFAQLREQASTWARSRNWRLVGASHGLAFL